MPQRRPSLINQRFGKLLVTGDAPPRIYHGKKHSQDECLCDCGTIIIARRSTLTSGSKKSCGCTWKAESLVGQVFGKYTVIKAFPPKSTGNRTHRSLCRCVCGREKIVSNGSLRRGVSNGCLNCRFRTHGLAGTDTYQSWYSMIDRCTNPKHDSYKHYGGRGITVCERWLKVEHFWEDMGERPPGKTIDRINNNGNYEPGNCRWATQTEQHRNRRDNVIVTVRGITGCIAELCKHFGVKDSTVYGRIRIGWSPENAFFTPNSVRGLRVNRQPP